MRDDSGQIGGRVREERGREEKRDGEKIYIYIYIYIRYEVSERGLGSQIGEREVGEREVR